MTNLPAMKLLMLALASILCTSSYAQTTYASGSNAILPKKAIIKIPSRIHQNARVSGKIKSFQVQDARPDTSILGVYSHDWENGYRQYTFENPVATEIERYLNLAHSNADKKSEILIVLRKLWLADLLVKEKPRQNDRAVTTELLQLRCRFDCYLKSDSFYVPLIRYDTVMSGKKRNTLSFELLQNALLGLTAKIEVLNLEAKKTRPKYLTRREVDSFSLQSFSLPAFTQPVKKGVFKDLNDFKNNDPGIMEYEVKKEKNFSVLYIKDDKGNFYHTRSIWGFSDGKTLYIMLRGNLFPVQRRENNFYILGAKDMVKSNIPVPIIVPLPGAMMVGTMPVSTKTKLRVKVLTLDMDTGETY